MASMLVMMTSKSFYLNTVVFPSRRRQRTNWYASIPSWVRLGRRGKNCTSWLSAHSAAKHTCTFSPLGGSFSSTALSWSSALERSVHEHDRTRANKNAHVLMFPSPSHPVARMILGKPAPYMVRSVENNAME